ncbi:MAG: putative 4-hydroxybenzoate polyprenyltransferase [Spirochaetia bacterium]|jgi:4-hydroxybenzoate polyprenyltransferase|nr:putative 4-hydroxybenzoate polyprenyltransferase [Spirochaetia bacterium]
MNILLRAISRVRAYGALVMFSHTLFSLPFAMITMLLAAGGMPPLRVFLWIIIALFAGRNGANALNRYVDASIDAKNPRTAERHIPAGKIRHIDALVIAVVCFAVFIAAASALNRLCLYLSPAAVFLFCIYSYTKRFTWLCHIILGITCAGAPLGAWIAVTGGFHYIPLLFASAAALWIAGFDIIYGTQDIEFDRKEGLFSIPARFGLRRSLYIARVFHIIMWFMLLSLFFITKLSYIYLFGLAVCGILLIVEHYNVDPSHRRKMKLVSYNINQIIGLFLMFASVFDMIILW